VTLLRSRLTYGPYGIGHTAPRIRRIGICRTIGITRRLNAYCSVPPFSLDYRASSWHCAESMPLTCSKKTGCDDEVCCLESAEAGLRMDPPRTLPGFSTLPGT